VDSQDSAKQLYTVLSQQQQPKQLFNRQGRETAPVLQER